MAVRHLHYTGHKAPKSPIYLNLSEFGKQLTRYHNNDTIYCKISMFLEIHFTKLTKLA